jgi:hypothetical protein
MLPLSKWEKGSYVECSRLYCTIINSSAGIVSRNEEKLGNAMDEDARRCNAFITPTSIPLEKKS